MSVSIELKLLDLCYTMDHAVVTFSTQTLIPTSCKLSNTIQQKELHLVCYFVDDLSLFFNNYYKIWFYLSFYITTLIFPCNSEFIQLIYYVSQLLMCSFQLLYHPHPALVTYISSFADNFTLIFLISNITC